MNSQQALLRQVSEKQLILSVTAGRSGTRYLHNLFSLLTDVQSQHEGEPDYKHVLRRVQTQPSAATRFLLDHKLPAVAACPFHTFVETSHLFCKGFFEPLLNLGVRPDLVLLRRPPRKIAWSMLERATVPARTALGNLYTVSPADPNTLPLPGWELLSDYQLCFWYALEIERRQVRYRDLLLQIGGRVCDVTAAELNDPDRFMAMLETFSLAAGDGDALRLRHAQTTAVTHNKNPRKFSLALDFDAEEEEVWAGVAHYEPLLRKQVAERYAQAQVEV